MKYVNTDWQSRVWLHLQTPDGQTLELAPGETVELADRIEDPYLKPAKPAKTPAAAAAKEE